MHHLIHEGLLKKKKEYKVFNNLSKAERDALTDLSKDNMIVVRPADKGGAIVLQNVSDYASEIKRQLSDTTFYEKLSSDPTRKLKAAVQSRLTVHLNNCEFDKSVFDFLSVEHPVIPVIYTLPKIHKGLDIPLKGRPIVSGIGSLTENISAYVDHFIKPEVTTLPSYLRDSSDFINSLKSFDKVTNSILIATFDVQSLYTCIPERGGIEALEHFLSQRPATSKPSTACILDLAHIVLSNNYFRFENDFYLQSKGTAMGTKMAPNYACLYMGHFENQYVLNASNPFWSKILLYRRFIDDIFIIADCTVEELNCFHQYLNSCNDHLRFTLEYDRERISFLDVLVRKSGNCLHTEIFRKPTDRNTMLRGDSFHPQPFIKSLPISQFHRIRRVCSDDGTYAAQASDLSNRFLNRGYKQEWVAAARGRYDRVTQEECLQPRKKTPTHNSIMCSVRYSPLGAQFRETIRKHWHIVNSDPKLKNVFTEPPKLVFKRPNNIRDGLVRADINPQNTPKPINLPDGNYKCGGCSQCVYTQRCKTFTHPHTGRNISIRGAITCSTTHVIYMIRCPNIQGTTH